MYCIRATVDQSLSVNFGVFASLSSRCVRNTLILVLSYQLSVFINGIFSFAICVPHLYELLLYNQALRRNNFAFKKKCDKNTGEDLCEARVRSGNTSRLPAQIKIDVYVCIL